MNKQELINDWKMEENIAHIHGWDFSHIKGKFKSFEDELPWDYKDIILSYLKPEHCILDIDTGGGEFLLSLNHPYDKTGATEGFPPNVALCKETLRPLGIDFREMNTYSRMPFEDETFDIVLNRHGAYDVHELYRILKPGGLFITQQVGEDNDRALVELLQPGTQKSFPGQNLATQRKLFEKAGFSILLADEAYRPIQFYDIGALVWFARIIQWEFVDFSVDKCLENLLEAQKIVEQEGYVEGMTHRYVIVSKK